MPEFEYSGGSLCLDFANTWGDRSDLASDQLRKPHDLLDWAHGAGILSERELSDFEKLAHLESDKMLGVFRFALELRDTVFELCSTVAAGKRPEQRHVATLNAAVQTVPRQQLCCAGDCCTWEWPAERVELRQILWPVIQSAAELVTSPDATRIRECGAPDCNWLFIDRSRGGRRKWCDMSTCGNRAKARRYYERHRRNP
jgi:predicted RNA-binding Zn ribbon-like protein